MENQNILIVQNNGYGMISPNAKLGGQIIKEYQMIMSGNFVMTKNLQHGRTIMIGQNALITKKYGRKKEKASRQMRKLI